MSAEPFRSMYVPPRIDTVDAAEVAHRVKCYPDLLEALQGLDLRMPPAFAACHVGLVPQELCGHCSGIARALAAIAKAEAPAWDMMPGGRDYEDAFRGAK